MERAAVTSVGIAVKAVINPVDRLTQIWVLLPVAKGDDFYVEVEVVDEFEVIQPPMPEWKLLTKAPPYDCYGYPMSEAIDEHLFLVWDDAAKRHMGESIELFRYYEYLIEYYRRGASEYIDALCEENYRSYLAYAVANGWDTQIIKERQSANFPYTGPIV